jgi:hypothetical protein
MKYAGADVSEAVFAAGRNNKRLSAGQDGMVFADPHLGFTCDYSQHFLDRVRMRGSACSRRYPLLENAKLCRTVTCRNLHPGFHSRPPPFPWLIRIRNDLHSFLLSE